MKYAIGLDVGIESVGYSVLELDTLDQPIRTERLGSRIFDKAEHPDGAMIAICDDSLAPMSFSQHRPICGNQRNPKLVQFPLGKTLAFCL